MPVDWMQEFNKEVSDDNQRKQAFSDDFRKQKIADTMAASNNLHKSIALMLDPDTMQPLPGKEAQVAQLRTQLGQLDGYVKNLYNPKFDPQKGAITEDPLHKLGDLLHITKPPAQPYTDYAGAPQPKPATPGTVTTPVNKTAGQQLSDLQDITSKYSDSTALDQSMQNRAMSQKVEGVRALLTKYGASDKTIMEVTEGMLGGPKPGSLDSKSKWGVYLKSRADRLGKEVSELTPAEIEDANRDFSNSGRAAKETIVPDTQSSTGFAKIGYDADGQEMYHVRDVVPPRGVLERQTTTTDPFGVTSTMVSKPVFPGVKQGVPAASAPSAPTTSSGTTSVTPSKTPKPTTGTAKVATPSKIGQLDANGHIPETDKVNPNLREAANNILDGMAVKDLPIPQRDRGAAEALAKKYGWMGQGMFTPKDRLLVRESSAILNQMKTSPALDVLDDSMSRQKLIQVLHNPEKRGAIGGMIQTAVAGNLSPAEQQFVTLFNQAVGRISGLSQLVRSGRATEAQIERLKSELPNPATTTDANHARQKLAQIQNEIDIAMQKGQFVDGQQGSGPSITDDEFLMKVGR